jgi:imidazolonepropionase-like amidohydrolase
MRPPKARRSDPEVLPPGAGGADGRSARFSVLEGDSDVHTFATAWALAFCAAPMVPAPAPVPTNRGVTTQDAPASDPASAKPGQALLIRANKLYIRPDRVLEDGAILVQDGIILAVGKNLEKPEGARELTGKVVCAGFVDPWSVFGLDPRSVTDDRTSPASRTADGLDPYVDPRVRRELLRAGITSMRVQIGSTSRVGGKGILVPNRALGLAPAGPTGSGSKATKDRRDPLDCCVSMTIGITRDGRGVDLFDRMGEIDRAAGMIAEGLSYQEEQTEYKHDLAEWEKTIAEKEKELDEGFKKAKKDREKEQADAKEKSKEFKEKAYKEDKKPRPPKYDPDKEVMARVGNGELALVVEAHRSSELRALLEATKRFDRLRLIIAGGTDALSVADELKQRHIPVLVWPAPHGAQVPDEFENNDLALAGRLEAAGVEVLLGSGGRSAEASRDLPLLAALAVGHGLPREQALEALTLGAARTFAVADRIGSLERGKEADVLVLDGEPLETTTRVQYVVSRGEVVVTPEER